MSRLYVFYASSENVPNSNYDTNIANLTFEYTPSYLNYVSKLYFKKLKLGKVVINFINHIFQFEDRKVAITYND